MEPASRRASRPRPRWCGDRRRGTRHRASAGRALACSRASSVQAAVSQECRRPCGIIRPAARRSHAGQDASTSYRCTGDQLLNVGRPDGLVGVAGDDVADPPGAGGSAVDIPREAAAARRVACCRSRWVDGWAACPCYLPAAGPCGRALTCLSSAGAVRRLSSFNKLITCQIYILLKSLIYVIIIYLNQFNAIYVN